MADATCKTCPFSSPWKPTQSGDPRILCHHVALAREFTADDEPARLETWWCSEHPERAAVAGRVQLTRDVIAAADAVRQELGRAEWADPQHAEEILRGIIHMHWQRLDDAVKAHPLYQGMPRG
jgi:hypothetical protein